ncbi:PREDICTED: uncharacterized protein LOC108975002 [Bactrocera latifrons]|uniref:Uncharacterized protein n=1 Tax=Bactrocera latifrons TaxID=174628 RepID=A0A0K8V9E3_BACLA|nr:PREDICTED: uncharacterized protein LOC108975002 [Bactrocera latifrons]
MKFLLFMVSCAMLSQSHTRSITKVANTDTATAFGHDYHNSSKNGYGYEQPKIQFNYPKADSAHTNYKASETINYLNYQSAHSKLKPVGNVPLRLLFQIPKMYASKPYKHEKDLRTIVEEREMRRPAPRRLVPYTEVITYAL